MEDHGSWAFGVLIALQFFRPERTGPPSDPDASFEAVAKPPQEIVDSEGRLL
jgi:hypothetical protein